MKTIEELESAVLEATMQLGKAERTRATAEANLEYAKTELLLARIREMRQSDER